MSKFYTASTQAKELCEEAKTAREKNKELNKEVLLKKREVIRLTEDLNRLYGVEMKLKNEVEELKADSVGEGNSHCSFGGSSLKVQLVLGESS